MKIINSIYDFVLSQYYLNQLRFRKLFLLGTDFNRDIRIFGKIKIIGKKSNIHIGKNCTLNEGVLLNGLNKLHIGDNTTLSSNVLIHTGYLTLDKLPRKHESKPIIIGNNVWIASGVVVVAGVTIGNDVVVGDNSVVTKDLDDGYFYAGIPCKKIKKINYDKYDE